MHFTGVEIASGRRTSTIAVLDQRLQILTLETKPIKAILEQITKHDMVICAVAAPLRPAEGDEGRAAERDLKERGLPVDPTPKKDEKAPSRIRKGWWLYNRLEEADFVDYPMSGGCRLLETHTEATFTAMVEKPPYDFRSLEGVLQRQALLRKAGVKVADPLKALQEITRHHLVTGRLDLEVLHKRCELNALLAAFTAYKAHRGSSHVSILGKPKEGVIVLPIQTLKDDYS